MTLEFPDLLRLIDERSTAFRAAVASAPSLDVQVPTCPEWTLFDLVQHLGEGRRRWAAIVAAGPADAPPARSASEGAPAAPREREALLAWLAASTQQLLGALREAGPDRGCWTWWGASQSPQTCRCRRPAPAPGDRGAHLRRPAHRGRPAAAAGRGGPRRCRRVPVHLLRNDERLAAQARCRRLPRHRGPLLAPPALRRRRTDRPAPRRHMPAVPARTRTRPTPPPGARPVSWS